MNQDENKFPIDITLLLRELGLDKLPEEQKAAISDMMQRTIEAKIRLYLNEYLPAEDLKALAACGDDGQKIIQYLASKDIDLNQIVIAVAQESREEFMRDVEYIRGLMDGQKGA